MQIWYCMESEKNEGLEEGIIELLKFFWIFLIIIIIHYVNLF